MKVLMKSRQIEQTDKEEEADQEGARLLRLILLTVFVAQCHNPVHVISIVHNITREVFDIDAYIRPFFHL